MYINNVLIPNLSLSLIKSRIDLGQNIFFVDRELL